jgi:hypothetical protein
MPITDQEAWDKWVEANDDPYGKCCVDVARRVMELLDEDPTTLRNGYHPDPHTAHGLICKADDDIKAGGITGFMAGCVAEMVFKCHSRGDEFRRSHNGDVETDGVVNHALVTISVPEGKDVVDVIKEAAEDAGMEVMDEEETKEFFGIDEE